MAKIPPIKRFRSEDYPDLPAGFLQNLSLAIESMVFALDNFLNFDNISGDIYERVTIPLNTSITPDIPYLLPWRRKYAPVAVFPAGLWEKGADSRTALSLSPSLEWDYDSTQKQIIIKKINGLTLPSASVEYQITILAFCK
jgi:hypothetical protein